MRSKAAALTALAFILAAVFSLAMALAVGSALESRSQRHVQRALNNSGLDWVTASADGLLVTLSGTAPSDAIRFRAATVAARVVGNARIIDDLKVVPTKALSAPRFSLELLRNGDGVSVIGLAPASWDMSGFLDQTNQLAEDDFTNMVETADFAIPSTWDEAIDFGLAAVRLLPRSKISIAADEVRVTAIAESPEEKHSFEAALKAARPQGVPTRIDISAPRPVIAPFTLRFVMGEEGPRFDACSADTERARARILAAGRRAGVPGTVDCVLGLGAPSPRWSEAAELLITAMKDLGAGTVSISDVDVTLIADHTVTQMEFDRIVGELTSKLPDVFSLKATLTPKPLPGTPEGVAQFTATLAKDGKIQLRGRVTDQSMRDMVDAFARARFGASNVYVATRFDEQLPASWGSRVLSSLAALAEVSHGAVLVETDAVSVRGTTGNAGASAEIARLLSDKLGQGARYSVDVSYDERLDPTRGLPSPAECVLRAQAVLDARSIRFAPNATQITGEAGEIVDALAEALKECAGARLEVGGHTDSQGSAEGNLRLSQRRAEAVLAALTEREVDTTTMSAKGYGAAEPVADNGTEDGREQNRRIAFKLLADPEPLPIEEVIRPEEPEDDGEAIPQDVEAPSDEVVDPTLDEGGDEEPMGEAGDLGEGEEAPPLDEDSSVSEDVNDAAAEEAAGASDDAAPAPTGAAPPDAAAPTPDEAEATIEAPANTEAADDLQPAPEALRPALRPETGTPAADGAAPAAGIFDNLTDGWEVDGDLTSPRPPRRSTEFQQ